MSTIVAYAYALAAFLLAIAAVLFVIGFFTDKHSGENDQLVFFAKEQMARALALVLVVFVIAALGWYLLW